MPVWPPRASGGGITQAQLDAAIATRLAATAAAGGVLAGNYPNPGFAVDMATQAELDAAVLGAGGGASGPAGGVLGGNYPNPSFAVDMATQAELDAAIATRQATGAAAGGVLAGTYPNPGFATTPIMPGAAAGGDLTGTYPNPTFAVDMATQAELNAAIAGVATLPIAIAGLSKDGASIGRGAFRVHPSATLNPSSPGVAVFDTVDFDLQTWYSTANGKFTPQTKGLYLLIANLVATSFAGASTWSTQFRKNGTTILGGVQLGGTSGAAIWSVPAVDIVAFNGTTDYVEVLRTTNSATTSFTTASYFGGVLLTPQT